MLGILPKGLAVLVALATPVMAETRVVCTLVAEAASGRAIIEEGSCGERRSPASTFKVALALMGFDAGILTAPTEPEVPFRDGYVDWRPEWKRPTTPQTWMRDSVVWYSQWLTSQLGMARFAGYVEAFDYGNRDVSGDPGKANGLTNAWLSSSLQISPEEQVAFLRKLLRRNLPVSAAAMAETVAIMDLGVQPGGWHIHGKTGAGVLRADGAPGRGTPFGWFVGWAERGGRTVVFARLIQDEARQDTPPGFRARDTVFSEIFGPGGALD